MLCGGWSKFRALEPEDAKLFKEIVTLQGWSTSRSPWLPNWLPEPIINSCATQPL